MSDGGSCSEDPRTEQAAETQSHRTRAGSTHRPSVRKMQPKAQSARQHNNTPRDDGQHNATMRNQSGAQRAQRRASMTTEYQERFLPPGCIKTIVSTSVQRNPYHPLRGRADMTSMRTYYVTNNWVKEPPKLPQPPLQPKAPRRSVSAPINSTRVAVKQLVPRVTNYTSVYKNDFQAWKALRCQPYKLSDSLKVNQGLVVVKTAVEENCSNRKSPLAKPQSAQLASRPFESTTSYRADYVAHAVQPRGRRREGPVKLPLATLAPKLAWQSNRELLDGVSDLFQQFKTWSLETKLNCQSRGGGRGSGPPADPGAFLSTTHAAYTPHKCQRARPVLPSVRSGEGSKAPFLATTTMKEDYKAWDTL